jgi:RNA polymerase sigma-70 factor, ECF subfamily
VCVIFSSEIFVPVSSTMDTRLLYKGMDKSLEVELLRRAKCFDLQALAEVYDQYSPEFFAYSARLLGCSEDAEECVAETFSRFLRALKNGGGPRDHLRAYLYRIAHNWITDRYRQQPPVMISLEEEMINDAPIREIIEEEPGG